MAIMPRTHPAPKAAPGVAVLRVLAGVTAATPTRAKKMVQVALSLTSMGRIMLCVMMVHFSHFSQMAVLVLWWVGVEQLEG